MSSGSPAPRAARARRWVPRGALLLVALGLAFVAQDLFDRGHTLGGALAVGGVLAAGGWVSDLVAGVVARWVTRWRGGCPGTSSEGSSRGR